jgi:hypothetical protein
MAVSVAGEPLDLGKEVGIRPPPREHRHLVPSVKGRLHQVAADERRASENEQPHRRTIVAGRAPRTIATQHAAEMGIMKR